MATGLGLLRLSPKTFWSMTLRELEAAIGIDGAARPRAPVRAELDALMHAFPDETEDHGRP